MSEELVKRLEICRKRVVIGLPPAEAGKLAQTITDAIAALTAPQAETCGRSATDLQAALARLDVVHDRWVNDAAEGYFGDNPDACQLKTAIQDVIKLGTVRSRPWTREDGSTTPERGDVVDRRQSAEGDQHQAPSLRRQDKTYFGRRSADRARWTVQETEQTLADWVRKRFPRSMLHAGTVIRDTIYADELLEFARELDRRSGSK